VQIVDANVLLYAVNSDSAHHAAARAWIDDALAGPGTVGFSWGVLLAFVRISTHRATFERPLSVDEAIETCRSWLAQPSAVVIESTTRHLDMLAGLLASSGTAGNLVSDAHLAALAVEHAAEVVTFDADFGRFAGLSWTWLGS
jgi:toxin-antitoxin system PIN domain toxin